MSCSRFLKNLVFNKWTIPYTHNYDKYCCSICILILEIIFFTFLFPLAFCEILSGEVPWVTVKNETCENYDSQLNQHCCDHSLMSWVFQHHGQRQHIPTDPVNTYVRLKRKNNIQIFRYKLQSCTGCNFLGHSNFLKVWPADPNFWFSFFLRAINDIIDSIDRFFETFLSWEIKLCVHNKTLNIK